jgi:S-formylglutathione hydrolase FrmB
MARPKRRGALSRAILTGLGVPFCLLLVTGVVRATGLPSVTSGPRGSAAVAAAGLTSAAPVASSVETSAPTATPTPTPTPTTPTATPPPTATVAPTPSTITVTPLVWSPSGSGQVTIVNLPAPWTGGTQKTAQVTIYTPPGYSPSGSQLYPVIYEAPTGLATWSGGTFVAELDSLITSGTMPAAIVVFIDEAGVPISPSECVDSANGQQWFETYVTKTVVGYVDGHYKTIADPSARATMGMSEGGFCAAMLATRHPDLFSVSISFSGYYWAGTPAPDAMVPYGGNQALLDAYSPALLVPKIPEVVRASMYFIVVANWSQDYFGPQATAFDSVLTANGYAYLAVNSPYPHGWPEVQTEAPGALKAWGARLVISGV